SRSWLPSGSATRTCTSARGRFASRTRSTPTQTRKTTPPASSRVIPSPIHGSAFTVEAMSFADDVRAARRGPANRWRSLRARTELARTPGAFEHPRPHAMKIAVYYSDTNVNLYRLRQWYAPLVELSKTWPVVVIARSPGAML